jgi:outer membrane protein assembly factor BamB
MSFALVQRNLAQAGDWANWRGPERTGVARDKGLPEKFSLDPADKNNNLIWQAPFGGRATPIVMNGRVYLNGNVGEGPTDQERVVCVNADTGEKIWEQRFNAFLTDIVAVRVGWTNLVGDPETDCIYAHGIQGFLICFNGKDGKVVWSHSMTEEYGRISGYGGRLCSPVVDGDLVIVGMLNASWGQYARGGNRFVAFDKRTGEVVWWTETGFPPKDTYYSVPVVAVINGERLLITGGADGGVHAFQVRTGKKVWSYIFGTGMVNCSPVVEGTKVYIGHGD